MAGDQRRLAAIVVADVAGYSRLMGQDESGTLAALRALRRELIDPKIAEHSGRLVKTMGDGLLLEFASAVNAVRCSVDVQRAMIVRNADVPPDRLMQFRVGINVGDIIIEGEDIFGDGVNVAARLQTLAARGGICVSKVVYDQVQGKVDVAFDALGAQAVKNIAHPVEVYGVRLDSAGIGAPVSGQTMFRRFTPTALSKWVAAALLTLVAASLGLWMFPRIFEPAPIRSPPALTVAIAPLKAQGGDAESSQFAGAFVRHLNNHLSDATSLGRLRVMAGGASADTPSRDARQASGFRYLIEGDIGHDDRRFDIHLRLLNAATGDQVWSTRHALQDTDLSAEFSPKLIALIYRLRSAVFAAETRRVVSQPLSRLTAPELVLYSRAAYAKDQSLAGVREALKIVDDALRVDPNYAPAWITKAELVNLEGDVDPDQDRDRIGREQDAYTARAVALDATDSTAWNARATALVYLARWDGALEAASKAIMIEPHELFHRLTYAWIRGLMGQPDEALVIVDEVVKIDSERLIGGAMRTACEAHVLAGHASAAVTACEKSAVLYGDWITTVYLVAAYANNGDMAKAKTAKAELLRVVPGYTIAQLRAKRYSDHPDYLALAERNWYSGLRKAGIPER